MNTKSKFALSIAGILLLSGVAFADELVQLGSITGEGGPVSYIKTTPQKTSVAVFKNRHGIAGSTARSSEQEPGKFVQYGAGTFGENGPVSFFTGGR